MNDSALNGYGNGFSAIGDTEFRQDVFQIPFDRVFSDIQNIRNLLIGQAFDQLIEDLQLARRQFLKQTS